MLFNYLVDALSLNGAAYIAVFATFAFLCIVIPYIIGSLNFAVIISKIFYRDDIRKYGSGNAGATNMLRTYGKGAGAATMVLDMLKCVFSIGICLLLIFPISEIDPESGVVVAYKFHPSYLGGLFCILGHMFPCFYKFNHRK